MRGVTGIVGVFCLVSRLVGCIIRTHMQCQPDPSYGLFFFFFSMGRNITRSHGGMTSKNEISFHVSTFVQSRCRGGRLEGISDPNPQKKLRLTTDHYAG